MNIYAIIILVTLAVDFIVNGIADYLNIKAMNRELPEEFREVYDEEAYRKSQLYTRVKTRFGIITSLFDLAVLLLFWFFGGFNWLDHIVRGWNLGMIWTGLAYIGLLLLGKSIFSLPFSIYSTFVIEEKFGFNKTTPRTFITDLMKGLGLGIVLGGPLLAGVLAFFEFAGTYAWLYCWGAVTLFTLIIQYIAPTWIMPIFNKFSPLENEDLKTAIMDYAGSVNFSLEGVYVIDGSRRSTKSNAFFTGFGKNKRVALFDTLIEKHSIGELVAVLAHEIGHYKKKHIVKNMVTSILHMGVMFLLLSFFLHSQGLFDAFYMDHMSVYAGLIFFGMLYSPVELILSMVMQVYSRKHEYEADRYASETYSDPEQLIHALKKLSRDNLSNLTPHPFYVFLNYSHPTVLQRISAIRKIESEGNNPATTQAAT